MLHELQHHIKNIVSHFNIERKINTIVEVWIVDKHCSDIETQGFILFFTDIRVHSIHC